MGGVADAMWMDLDTRSSTRKDQKGSFRGRPQRYKAWVAYWEVKDMNMIGATSTLVHQ